MLLCVGHGTTPKRETNRKIILDGINTATMESSRAIHRGIRLVALIVHHQRETYTYVDVRSKVKGKWRNSFGA